MKRRSTDKPLPRRSSGKKKKMAIAPIVGDSFTSAMRSACLDADCSRPLSNQPLIVNAMDSSCWLSFKVAYWPRNEAIGRRVYEALEKEDNQHSGCTGEDDNHLIGYFMSFDRRAKSLCKALGVKSLDELGILRRVGLRNNDFIVDASLLDAREFRLDLQY